MMTKYGMVIDLKRCIGCDTCTVACRAEHATSKGGLFNRVFKFEVGKYPNSKLGFLPVTCMHCGKPECEKQCPTGATRRREDGIVVVDSEKCMGCQYCVVTCPYGTRYFLDEIKEYVKGRETPYEKKGRKKHRKGAVEKCDFCLERLEKGMQPACVTSCIATARYFGDLNDPNSEVSRLVALRRGYTLNPELGTEPSVYYLPDY